MYKVLSTLIKTFWLQFLDSFSIFMFWIDFELKNLPTIPKILILKIFAEFWKPDNYVRWSLTLDCRYVDPPLKLTSVGSPNLTLFVLWYGPYGSFRSIENRLYILIKIFNWTELMFWIFIKRKLTKTQVHLRFKWSM